MGIEERIILLKDMGSEIKKAKNKLIRSFAEDIGVSVKIGNIEVDMTVDYLQSMEEEAPWIEKRKPYGKIGAVLPYDAPTMMFARIAGSAILGQNRVILSFSSLNATTRDIMVEIMENFKEELHINRSLSNRDFSLFCTNAEDVKVFFISGGRDVGELFKNRINNFEKIIFAGPGGMPPVLVLEDANVEKAAFFTAKRAFLNGGQYCTTIKRALVHENVFDDFMEILLSEVDKIKVGDPFDPETDYGPIKAKRTRILVERALNTIKGDIIRGNNWDKGEFIPPIVMLTDEIPDLEMFGPFLAVKKYKSKDEIIKDALNTKYPFIVYVFGSLSESEKLKIKETYGMHHFNPDFLFLPLRGPFGGKKESGWILEKKNNHIIKRDGAIIYSVEFTKPL